MHARGTDVEWAASQAQQAIAANDVAALARWLAECPKLKTWRDPVTHDVLLNATTSYANFPGAEEEDTWNRRDCAELLLDQGAVVDPSVVLRLIDTGAHGMLALFHRKGALPRNLRVIAALGDAAAVTECFDASGRLKAHARPDDTLVKATQQDVANWPDPGSDLLVVADAFLYSCRLGHGGIAADLLQRCFAMDADLQQRVRAWQGEAAFIEFLLQQAPQGARFDLMSRSVTAPGPVWRCATELRVHAALQDTDVNAVRALLKTEPFLLDDSSLAAQEKLLQVAAYTEGALPIIDAIVNGGAAIARVSRPPASRAISYALEYGHAGYVPLLARIWDVPQDLPHTAALGRLREVSQWFDDHGSANLGDLSSHSPFPDQFPTITEQDVLDRALAWAVQNAEYEVADFLLARGADINTRWGTHEPASILHECAAAGRLEQVKYLVDRGIDTTIRDFRFNSTAEGWATYGGQDEVAQFLANRSKT